MAGDNPAPVIIKRKKVVSGEGHHGGAWKVAYADFVTAMMAFFMLMWLLNATTEKQRKGIADYFNPTIPVNRISGGGEGMFGGTNIFSDEVLARSGTGGFQDRAPDLKSTRDGQIEALRVLSDAISEESQESDISRKILEHITAHITENGLVIDVYDLPDALIYEASEPNLTPLGRQVFAVIAKVLMNVPESVSVTGHTAARPVVVRGRNAWSISTGRANATRAAMVAAGLPSERIWEVRGRADREPHRNPAASVENNRVRILLEPIND